MEVLSPGHVFADEEMTHAGAGRPTPRPWDRAQEAMLLDMVGTQCIPTVAKYLRRTPKAVRSKLQRMETPVEDLAGFKGKDLVNWFNVTPKQVRRWREKGYLRSAAGRITEESLEAFCRNHPEKIPYDELGEHVQLWLRDLGYPAVDGLSPRELADKLNVSRRLVAYWLRHCWLREVNGKVPVDPFRRFCRVHPDQIPYARLDSETQEWLRSMGYQRGLAGAQPAPVAEAPANLPEPHLSGIRSDGLKIARFHQNVDQTVNGGGKAAAADQNTEFHVSLEGRLG